MSVFKIKTEMGANDCDERGFEPLDVWTEVQKSISNVINYLEGLYVKECVRQSLKKHSGPNFVSSVDSLIEGSDYESGIDW